MTSKAKAAAVAEPIHEPQLPAVINTNTDRSISGWLSVQEILARKKLIDDVMRKVMREGEHYGASYPGDKKKNLLKPGADTLLMTFQLVPEAIVDVVDLGGGHREYRISATIRTSTGMVVANGVGSCSTMEAKYRWRHAKAKCPKCGAEALMKSKYDEGWYCNPKGSGCGANVPGSQVTPPEHAKVENPDIADVWNTCLKIAKKRAIVEGTISALACSDVFAQDADDLEKKIDQEEEKPSRSTVERQEQMKREAKPAAPVNATPAPVNAPPPAVNTGLTPAAEAERQLDIQLGSEYGTLQVRADKGTASKFWKQWAAKDQKPARLDAMRRANVALKAITDRLGPKAEGLLRDILLDRQNPDDVPGILADLERAAAPASAAPAPASPASDHDEAPY